MNANHEHELKIAVERIVRPIRAAEKDKLKMREELYAHALDAFAHEQSREDQDSAAVERAVERLGDPDATRRELQATVGWESRSGAWVDRFLRRPGGTPIAKHARNVACRLVVVFAIYVALLLVPIRWEELIAWNSEGRLLARIMVALCVLFGSAVYFAIFLSEFGWRLAARRYHQRGDYWKVAGLLLASAATVCAHGWCFTYAVSFDIAASFFIMRWWLCLSVPVALLALVATWLDAQERRPLAEWLDLDLGETVAE